MQSAHDHLEVEKRITIEKENVQENDNVTSFQSSFRLPQCPLPMHRTQRTFRVGFNGGFAYKILVERFVIAVSAIARFLGAGP